jgi:hypothetical protein
MSNGNLREFYIIFYRTEERFNYYGNYFIFSEHRIILSLLTIFLFYFVLIYMKFANVNYNDLVNYSFVLC